MVYILNYLLIEPRIFSRVVCLGETDIMERLKLVLMSDSSKTGCLLASTTSLAVLNKLVLWYRQAFLKEWKQKQFGMIGLAKNNKPEDVYRCEAPHSHIFGES